MNKLIINDPIFIIGSERSGTNLLQRLISNHSKIDGPKSPHLMNTFFDTLRYINPTDTRLLSKSMVQVANHPFSDWKISSNFIESSEFNSLGFFELVGLLYGIKTEESKKQRYVSKELNAHKHIYQLLKLHPKAKFIHLIRDPREQVASWMRTPLFLATPFAAMDHWVKIQNEILNLQAILPGKILSIRYEDVVFNTETCMNRLFNFIDEDIEKVCYETKPRKTNESNVVKLWENLDKPIGNKLNKHREILSLTDIEMIESLGEDLMHFFSYPSDTNKSWKMNWFYRLRNIIYSRRSRKKIDFKGHDFIQARVSFANKLKSNLINSGLYKHDEQ